MKEGWVGRAGEGGRGGRGEEVGLRTEIELKTELGPFPAAESGSTGGRSAQTLSHTN